MIEDVQQDLDELESYETAYSVRVRLQQIGRLIDAKEDILAEKTGMFRRGFFSLVDSTFRPYSVRELRAWRNCVKPAPL